MAESTFTSADISNRLSEGKYLLKISRISVLPRQLLDNATLHPVMSYPMLLVYGSIMSGGKLDGQDVSFPILMSTWEGVMAAYNFLYDVLESTGLMMMRNTLTPEQFIAYASNKVGGRIAEVHINHLGNPELIDFINGPGDDMEGV